MSWQTWQTTAPPMPATISTNPLQSSIIPGNVNPAPILGAAATPAMPASMQYSPEQWAQMQQQNWQQWAQWQQQYQQWHQQYGAEYQKSINAMNTTAAPPPPPTEQKPPPPPPPEEKVTNAPPPGYVNQYTTAPPPTKQYMTQGSKRPMPPQVETTQTKRQMMETNWNKGVAPAPAQPKNVNLEELSEAEKKFDTEFAAWEAQFNKWKEQNANHPDKTQYKEYEKKWESWRNSLLDRREQMRKKRLALQASMAPKSQFSQPPPAVAVAPPKTDLFSKPPPTFNNEPLTFKPTDSTKDSIGDNFLKSSSPAPGGIPGLDLVKEGEPPKDDEDIVEATEVDKPKGPDLDAISKGINTLLGDPNLLNMLSMVSQNSTKTTDTPPQPVDVRPPQPQYEEPSEPFKSEVVNNFDDQTRMSFSNGPSEHSNSGPPPEFKRFEGGRNSFDETRPPPGNFSNRSFDETRPPPMNFAHRDFDETRPPPGNFPNRSFDETRPPPGNFANRNFDETRPPPGNFPRNFPNRPPPLLANRNLDDPKPLNNFNRGFDDQGPQGNQRPPGLLNRSFDDQGPSGNLNRKFDDQRPPVIPNRSFDDQRPPSNLNRNFDGQRPPGNSSRSFDDQRTPGNFNRNFDDQGPPGNFNRNFDDQGPPGNFNRNFDDQGPLDNFRDFDDQGHPGNFNRNFDDQGPSSNFNRSFDGQRPPNNFNRSLEDQRPTGNFNRGFDDQRPAGNFNRSFDNQRPPGNINRNFDDGRPQGFNNRNNFEEDSQEFPEDYNDYDQNQYEREEWNEEEDFDKFHERFNEEEQSVPEAVLEPPVDDEPMFVPDKVIDYEHKSNKQPMPEVSLDMLRTFDYRHKPVNRIPYPMRPTWLYSTLRNIMQFDPLIGTNRFSDRPPTSRYDDPPANRYNEPPINRHPEKRYHPDRDPYEYERRPTEPEDRYSRDRYGKRLSYSPPRKDKKRAVPAKKLELEELSDEDNWDEDKSKPLNFCPPKQLDMIPPVNLDNPLNKTPSSQVTNLEELINPPGRLSRPQKIVIILRGPPGSGKTYLAKLIKDKEVENGGSAPRILALDDYFMVEHEKVVVEDGKQVKVKEMVYEYEAEMEESYRHSLVKSFKKTIVDGFFSFVIVDNVNQKVKNFGEMWSFAKQNGFQVYICQMDLDPQLCISRNNHNRSKVFIEDCIADWEPTPSHHPILDPTNFLRNSNAIQEVEMEEVEPISDEENFGESLQAGGSKWDTFDCSLNNLARLDGVSKPLKPSRTMEEYLQLEDGWAETTSKPGKKRVRWADLEEQKQQRKMKAFGFVVGQDWNRVMDPTNGSSALTQTKYIESRYDK